LLDPLPVRDFNSAQDLGKPRVVVHLTDVSRHLKVSFAARFFLAVN
jgi:hypothetical protein